MICEKYLFEDPAVAPVPADSLGLVVNSHGSTIYGRILLPGVSDPAERTPVVLMMHGYPGIERNADISPALQRTGMAVAEFSYRGVWGSHGYYCISHQIEDTETMLAYLRDNAEQYRIDPERIYLVAHSMGGFTALNVLARGAKVRGAVILAPGDIGYYYQEEPEKMEEILREQEQGYFTTPYPEYLKEDLAAHAEEWRFIRLAEKLSVDIPLRFVGATRDTIVPPEDHIDPLVEALRRRGADVDSVRLQDGHAFSSHRATLTGMVYRYIEEMDGRQ